MSVFEIAAPYDAVKGVALLSEEEILQKAKEICLARLASRSAPITSPDLAKEYIKTMMLSLGQEEFWVIYLDTQNKVIKAEKAFTGTLDSAAVYPREIVKRALQLDAKSIQLLHNHPSGNPDPSQADIQLTRRIKAALELIEVKLHDHFIVGKTTTSLAERGLV